MSYLPMEVKLDICNDTKYGADIESYRGNCNYTQTPSLLGSGGAKTEVLSYGYGGMSGSFVFDFNPQKYTLGFNFTDHTVNHCGDLPPHVILEVNMVLRESYKMYATLRFTDKSENMSNLQVNLDIYNDTNYEADIGSYGGKCTYTEKPSFLGSEGDKAEVYGYGGDDLSGSFVLDFHSHKYKLMFNYASQTVTHSGALPPLVILEVNQVQRESDTMNATLRFTVKSDLQVNIDIYNDTSYGADIRSYVGRCTYTDKPSVLGFGGAKAEVYSYGGDDLSGSFVLDFHPQIYTLTFNYASQTVTHSGDLPPHVILEVNQVQRESDTMNATLRFADL